MLHHWPKGLLIWDGTKVGKQPLNLRHTNKRRFEGSHMFLSMLVLLSVLIGYRQPPKLDYCFLMSTSLVPVSVSIQNRHCWTEK